MSFAAELWKDDGFEALVRDYIGEFCDDGDGRMPCERFSSHTHKGLRTDLAHAAKKPCLLLGPEDEVMCLHKVGKNGNGYFVEVNFHKYGECPYLDYGYDNL